MTARDDTVAAVVAELQPVLDAMRAEIARLAAPATDEWLTVEQAAEISGRHYKTVLEAVQSGRLRGYQQSAGSRWRIRPKALTAWIQGEPASKRARRLRTA